MNISQVGSGHGKKKKKKKSMFILKGWIQLSVLFGPANF